MYTTQKLQPLSQEMVSYPLALLVISQSLLSVKYFEGHKKLLFPFFTSVCAALNVSVCVYPFLFICVH